MENVHIWKNTNYANSLVLSPHQVLHPRFQRWLLRADEALDAHPATTTTINDDDDDITNSGGQQFAVKRVVSESELNSLLKNAWLGR